MQLDPSIFDGTLEAFLEAWSLERIESMTLLEYADLSNHDSFCYWLEYGTKNLGAIGNNPLTKFGIWKPKNLQDFSDRITSNKILAFHIHTLHSISTIQVCLNIRFSDDNT